MNLELIQLLRCPACGEVSLRAVDFSEDGRSEIYNGVVMCGSCPAWYPIEDELLELLAGALAYRDDRRRFWDQHSGRLTALGLTWDSTDLDQVRMAPQKHQQAHSDWYADNTLQTYSDYERLPFWQAVDAVTVSCWKEYLGQQQLVLDLGCAQGRSTSKLGDLDIRVIGFDVSKALVRQAMRREDRAQWRARTTFFVGDAARLPFRDEAFHAVLVYGVLHHLTDPQSTVRDIARVLTPGGFCFALENNKTILRVIFDLLQRVLPAWYEEAGEHALMSVSELEEWFRSAGLTAEVETSIFVPPHLLNLLSPSTGEWIVRRTDRLLRSVALTRRQGGLVRATARKCARSDEAFQRPTADPLA